jgi:hypothetical protein
MGKSHSRGVWAAAAQILLKRPRFLLLRCQLRSIRSDAGRALFTVVLLGSRDDIGRPFGTGIDGFR